MSYTLQIQLEYIYNKNTRLFYKIIHLLSLFLLMTTATITLSLITAKVFNAATGNGNFTDIFYSNSFRGSFEWIYKFNWLGAILQFVISVFSLFGVVLMLIRVITSMLYLSSKGIWEEVSELKKDKSDKDIFDLGLLGQLKSVGQGKHGTGVDALFGAILILLPDVKRYSDFSDGRSDKFSDDMTMTQYMLKIALPTIMCTFFFAMGFNGTMFKALGITVDAMGAVADKAVSVDYAGFLKDLMNSGQAYSFALANDGTIKGKLQTSIAKELYGIILSKIDEPNTNTTLTIGQKLENLVQTEITSNTVSSGGEYGGGIKLTEDDLNIDANWNMLGYDIVVNTTESYTTSGIKPISHSLYDWAGGSEVPGIQGESTLYGTNRPKLYAHVFVKQTTTQDTTTFAPIDPNEK